MATRTWLAAAVFAAALVVRLGFLAWQYRQPPSGPSGDDLEYQAYAESLLEGRYDGLDGALATRPPAYPAFLAVVRLIAGPSRLAVQLAQAVLGAATCALVAWTAAGALGLGWALAAGLAAAVYKDLLIPVPRLFSEGLAQFLLALFLWARNGRSAVDPAGGPPRPPLGRALAAAAPAVSGLLLGLAHLCRPELGVIALPALWSERRRGWGRAALFAAAFVATLLPWGLRNRAVLGQAVWTTTLGGFTLWGGFEWSRYRLGLRPEAPGMDAHPAGLSELETDKWYYRDAMRRIQAAPPALLFNAFGRNLLVLLKPFGPGFDATFALLSPLWAWCLLRPNLRRQAGLWAAAAATLSGVYVVFGGDVARYRQVFAPCLVFLAALGARDLWNGAGGTFKKRNRI